MKRGHELGRKMKHERLEVCVYACVRVCTNVSNYMCLPACIHMHAGMRAHAYAHMLHTWRNARAYAHICKHMHTYAHICTHMHTYAHICSHETTHTHSHMTHMGCSLRSFWYRRRLKAKVLWRLIRVPGGGRRGAGGVEGRRSMAGREGGGREVGVRRGVRRGGGALGGAQCVESCDCLRLMHVSGRVLRCNPYNT